MMVFWIQAELVLGRCRYRGNFAASARPQPFSYSVEEVDWVSGGGARGRGSSAREARVSSSAHLRTENG